MSFAWSVLFVSWLFICSLNWTEALSYIGYQEMCLIVRLAVGLCQSYIGDVRTFRVLEDIGYRRCDPKFFSRIVLKEYCVLHLAADTVTT